MLLLVPALAAILSVDDTARAAIQVSALTSLTAPTSDLPSGCRLRPITPSQKTTPPVVTAQPSSAFPYPSNPWSGTDRRLLLETREQMTRSSSRPMPPDPTLADIEAIRAQALEHVIEGYYAIYDSDRGSVEVRAIRFDDPSAATPKPSVQDELNGVPRGGGPIVAGDITIQVNGDPKSDCFRAVDAYVRSAK